MSKIEKFTPNGSEYLFEGNYILAISQKSNLLLFTFDTMDALLEFKQQNPQFRITHESFPKFENKIQPAYFGIVESEKEHFVMKPEVSYVIRTTHKWKNVVIYIDWNSCYIEVYEGNEEKLAELDCKVVGPPESRLIYVFEQIEDLIGGGK